MVNYNDLGPPFPSDFTSSKYGMVVVKAAHESWRLFKTDKPKLVACQTSTFSHHFTPVTLTIGLSDYRTSIGPIEVR